ncbi:hypothetical protein L2E82_22936 [Cichorium intybus]|uniref:Uncharacterized protein n=1 Tax=Cichorium intybus TaxID=13427 RepID=A0ACB9DZ50_CICIN|nr:hypothetical protein L2E82_22936 [Cichorium intybus]
MYAFNDTIEGRWKTLKAIGVKNGTKMLHFISHQLRAHEESLNVDMSLNTSQECSITRFRRLLFFYWHNKGYLQGALAPTTRPLKELDIAKITG